MEVTVEEYLKDNGLHQVQYGSSLTSLAITKDSTQFVWTVHHALYDGVSAARLLAAVEMIYKDMNPPDTAPAFKEFSHYLSSVDTDASAKFWRQQLGGGFPKSFPSSNLSHDPQPNQRHSWTFDVSSSRSVSGIRDSILLRAAWAMLTARYEGSDDVVFGAALSGRDTPLEGIEDMMGPTVTTVPIRVRLDKSQQIGKFLHQVQLQADAMIPYQHAGLQVLRQLGPDMGPALSFKNLFVVQHDMEKLELGFFLDESQDCGDLMTGYYDYPLVMECILGSTSQGYTRVTMDARYDAKIIPTAQIDRLCKQFRHIFQQLGSMGQSKTLDDVQTVSPEDIAAITRWNDKLPWYYVDRTVHDIIAHQIKAHPDDFAIVGHDGDMLYSQLDQYSTWIANTLVSVYGVGPEVIVPVCFEKSKWAVVAMLAILKAGGVVAHLGALHPFSRKKDILKQVDAKILLLPSKKMSEEFSSIIPTMIINQESMVEISTIEAQLPHVDSSNAAYILFTSGSTGQPKGIVVEHGNLCSSSSAHGDRFQIGRSTRVLQFAAYTFDISCADILTTLQRGGTICMPSEEERINDLAGAVTKYRANWMFVTPTVAKLLDPESMPTLRTLVLGGEAPTDDDVKAWAHRLNLILIYGPAETTIYASASPRFKPGGSPKRLGPAMGCHMWLCDPDNVNKIAPIGCVGEIVIDGPLVSRGYLRDKTKTQHVYVHPTWAETRRVYRTGDMARYDKDGVMSFVGREDDQVKFHGQRVELKEIEHHLLALQSVRSALACFPRHGPLQGKLVAVLSLSEPGVSDSKSVVMLKGSEARIVFARVRKALEERLPIYMIPTVWIGVEAIPRTTHGKTDRASIRDWVSAMDQETYQELINDREEEIIRLTTPQGQLVQKTAGQVLNLPNVHANRSFIGLGGDSITAMQLRTKLRAAGIDLSIRDILSHKALADLATDAVVVDANSSFAIHNDTLGVPFELSPIQRLFFETAGPTEWSTTSHFNQTLLLKANRTVEATILCDAIRAIVSRHSMLRARFSLKKDGWTQYLTDDIDGSYNFFTEKLQNRSELSQVLTQRSPLFDITNGPLFSIHLFQIGEEQGNEQLLFLSAHHLVVDIVSWLVILGEMEEFLTTPGPISTYLEKPLSFQTWLRSQRTQDESLEGADTLSSVLDNIPAPDFTYWNMHEQDDKYADVLEYSYALDEETTAQLLLRLTNFKKTEPVDVISAVLLQSFSAVFTDRSSLPTIFSEGHGRDNSQGHIDPSGTVGWFTTITPLHVPSVGNNVNETVRAVKNVRQTMMPNGPHFSVRRGGFGPGSTHMEILFNYLGQFRQLETENALFSDVALLDNEKIVDNGPDLNRLALLDISAMVAGGKFKMTFKYNRKMQHQDKITTWMAKSRTELEAVARSLDMDDMIRGLGLNINDVKEIIPCVPLQQHMLSAMENQPGMGLYEIEMAFYLTNEKVDPARLGAAWQQVVDRHSILRTIFIPSLEQQQIHAQLILAHYKVDVPVVECTDLTADAQCYKSVDYTSKKPHHQLTLFLSKDGQTAACKLEMSHAINDGISTAIILRDLQQAYHGRLLGPAPTFSDFVQWQDKQSNIQPATYWQDFVRDVPPCTQANRQSGSEHKIVDLAIRPDISKKLREFCVSHSVTMATFFQVAWGLVLSVHTGHDKALFGYMTANRDVPIQRVSDMAGPLVNMLLCKVDSQKELSDLLQETHNDFLTSLEQQYSLLGSVQPTWNSIMSLQYLDSRVSGESAEGISFEQFWARDPNQWDVTVGVQISSESGVDSVDAFVGYWSDVMSQGEVDVMKRSFGEVIDRLMRI